MIELREGEPWTQGLYQIAPGDGGMRLVFQYAAAAPAGDRDVHLFRWCEAGCAAP